MEKHRLAEIQVAEIKAKEIEQLRLSAEKLKAIKPGQAKEAHEAKLAKERAVKDAKEKKKGGKAKKEEIAMDGLEFDTSVDVRRMLDWYTRDKRYDRFRDANGYMSPLVLRKAKQIIEAEVRSAGFDGCVDAGVSHFLSLFVVVRIMAVACSMTGACCCRAARTSGRRRQRCGVGHRRRR
jgi:hypothetical protein